MLQVQNKEGSCMSVEFEKYKTLFLSTFKLSACTFGGGFVIIPLMRKKFVEELGWIEEEEMLDLTAIAQSSPGAIAVNASILVGYHVFYKAFRDNAIVNMAMDGMLCGVAAVIFDVVINMSKTVLKQKRMLPVMVMICSFIAVRFLSVNIIMIILICGIIGAFDTVYRNMQQKGHARI